MGLEQQIKSINRALTNRIRIGFYSDMVLPDPSANRRALAVLPKENAGTPTQYKFYLSTNIAEEGQDWQWLEIASIGETELEWGELEW